MGINTMMELAGFSFRKFRVGGGQIVENPEKLCENGRISENCEKLHENERIWGNYGGTGTGGTNPDFEVFFGSPPTVENPD